MPGPSDNDIAALAAAERASSIARTNHNQYWEKHVRREDDLKIAVKDLTKLLNEAIISPPPSFPNADPNNIPVTSRALTLVAAEQEDSIILVAALSSSLSQMQAKLVDVRWVLARLQVTQPQGSPGRVSRLKEEVRRLRWECHGKWEHYGKEKKGGRRGKRKAAE